MNNLNLVLAPAPVYSKISEEIKIIDEQIISLASNMIDFLREHHAYGLAAPMFGISKRIIVIDTEIQPIVMINPKIISSSEDKDIMIEQSLSFIGIEVEVTRPKSINLEYLSLENEKKSIEADKIFARCIQHEIDYLNGITILNYVSKLKRDMLVKKMEKYKKIGYKPHVHTSSCNH